MENKINERNAKAIEKISRLKAELKELEDDEKWIKKQFEGRLSNCKYEQKYLQERILEEEILDDLLRTYGDYIIYMEKEFKKEIKLLFGLNKAFMERIINIGKTKEWEDSDKVLNNILELANTFKERMEEYEIEYKRGKNE